MRRLASWALWSFFKDIRVVGEENVPQDGPIIVSVEQQLRGIDALFPDRPR